MSVKQLFEVQILDKTFWSLTKEQFSTLQEQCREIAEFGKEEKMISIDKPGTWIEPEAMLLQSPSHVEEIDKEAPEINSTPIADAEIIKPLGEVVLSNTETTKQPMDTKILTDRIDKMRPYTSRKELEPFVAMHEAGQPMEAIKNAMINDDFCPKGSLPYFATKILKASTRVTRIELESAAETSEETIERLKRENAEGKEKRKQPKMAVK